MSRRDFISDNSSSEEEPVLPVVSLRERLARKRAITNGTLFTDNDAVSVSNIGKKSCIESSTDLDSNRNYSANSECIVITDTVPFQAGVVENEKQNENFEMFDAGVQSNRMKTKRIPANNECAVDSDTVPGLSNILTGVVHKPQQDAVFDASVPNDNTTGKLKKKRSQEEIEEGRKKAQEKREERTRQKMAKDAEKEMKKAERETKKQYSLASCLNYMTVLVDTHIVNTCGYGMHVFSACEQLGVTCQTLELPCPFTIMWRRTLTECSRLDALQVQTSKNEVEEGEVLAIIPVQDFVQMVHTFKQEQRTGLTEGVTLKRYIQQLQNVNKDKNITTAVMGLDQYFKELKSHTQKKHREAVQSTTANHVSKMGKVNESIKVSRVDIEQALSDAFLQTGACNHMVESPEELGDLVRRFTKAVAEKPAKKERFDAKFSFHEEGAAGVKVDKNGVGLLKVWKQQLMQVKNVSQDVAQALVAAYPSPQLLIQAYSKCESEKEAISLLENVVVRRGAGVLETSRRIGKELSRRLYTLFTQDDPDFVIK